MLSRRQVLIASGLAVAATTVPALAAPVKPPVLDHWQLCKQIDKLIYEAIKKKNTMLCPIDMSWAKWTIDLASIYEEFVGKKFGYKSHDWAMNIISLRIDGITDLVAENMDEMRQVHYVNEYWDIRCTYPIRRGTISFRRSGDKDPPHKFAKGVIMRPLSSFDISSLRT